MSRPADSADRPAPARPVKGPLSAEEVGLLSGLPASPGIAVGQVFRLRHAASVVGRSGSDPRKERRLLEDALDRAKVQLRAVEARVASEAGEQHAAVHAAHLEILEDPALHAAVSAGLAAGESAAFAWNQAVKTQSARLAGLDKDLLAARVADYCHVAGRVLSALGQGTAPALPWIPPGTILVAEDLTPAETASLDRNRVVGFCTVGGGATSHVAILARSFDLPAVVGIDARVLGLADGTTAILDGGAGTLRLGPTTAEIGEAGRRQARIASIAEAEHDAALSPAITTDGHRVQVVANARSVDDARQALAAGGEGIGLLRSELLFLDRSTAPSEDEQVAVYRAVAEALGPGRPLVIRTLDVGGDKPLAYLPIPPEANPFLGERGIRLFLDRPELLRTQLRAILRAAPGFSVRVMFPMISVLEEWRHAKAILDEETARLGVPPIPAGIMVEVASAALIADHLAREAEFFSVGTNDLTQYTLAMDRGHPRLAPRADGLHPAVLQLIQRAAEAAHRHGRRVAVCGGIASDPVTVPFLVGLGVDELSVAVPSIPGVKARVRALSLTACRELAQRALACGTATEVRALTASGPPSGGFTS